MMRVGLFKPVHVKTLVAQEQRMLLTSRKLLQRKLLDVESDLRGTLRNFGLKVGVVSGSRYEARVRELVAVLHKMLLDTVRGDPVCRRLMPRGRRGGCADLPCDGRPASNASSIPGRSARMSA
jgi:transposase